ncbi:MAG: nuclear transport factor 2 family protein [Deltaproteobacteria bacterium]|nr:nuclear transport factor 2 family protein [Kofleriaceae bacterium]
MQAPHDPAASNRRTMETLFAALARGDGAPFLEHLAEDVVWTLTGSTRWSRSYRGKADLVENLFRPLFRRLEGYTNTAHAMIAEGDRVVIECTGRAILRGGRPYANAYCWVCRLSDGRIVELTEYLDTRVVEAVLEDAPRG